MKRNLPRACSKSCRRPTTTPTLTLDALISPAQARALVAAIGAPALTGLTGAIGPAGVAGLTGGIGPQGIQGLIGAIGLSGLVGLTGAIGPAGVTGLAGLVGAQGIQGLIGSIGIQGIQGVVGPQGVTGIAGPPGVTEYAYVYNSTAEVVAVNAPVNFDANGPISADISHAPGSPITTLTNAGTYSVQWFISSVEPCQFTLFVNGEAILSTCYGSGAGTQQNTGRAIINVPANASLELRNHVSAAAVTLQTLAGGTAANINASLIILLLA